MVLLFVSIHVPTRGTTYSGYNNYQRLLKVSIHVPTRGTTLDLMTLVENTPMFQSTFPRGERRDPVFFCHVFLYVSIHVPTRGTTTCYYQLSSIIFVSIHVPTRGTTGYTNKTTNVFKVSIHVPTRGTTIFYADTSSRTMGFNPRSHEGNDRLLQSNRLQHGCFNPRSHEGNDSNHLQFLLIGLAGFYAIIPIYASQDKLYHL